jgi:hypothetical protein
MVVSALTLAGCACGTDEAIVTSDGKVDGKLTINGKSFPLKYVYAGLADQEFGQRLDVLITNEPLAYETLSRIFLELEVDSFWREPTKVLKGTSVKALYFAVGPYELARVGRPSYTGAPSKVNFEGTLMTSDTFFSYGAYSPGQTQFDEFKYQAGTIAAVAKNKWEQTETAENKEIKIDADFSVSFDAKVGEQSLLSRSLSSENKSWQETLSTLPDEGQAQGTLTVSGRVADLGYAYAMKEKQDDLKGVTTVLLTDEPIPKEFLLLSLKRRLMCCGYALRLQIDQSGKVLGSFIVHPHGQAALSQPASVSGFKVENGRVSGAVENTDVNHVNDEAEPNRYSVSFDAPLKN